MFRLRFARRTWAIYRREFRKPRILRSAGVQNALASVLSVWLRLCYATIRWEREGEHHARQVWAGDTGAILCLWHCFVPVGPFSWPQGPDRQDMRVLISRSADGELIALTMQKMGLPSIRGSSKKGSAPGKNKHGEQAFRDMIKWVRGGGGIAITPDGPRGRCARPDADNFRSAAANDS